jgi:uncharacterized protein YqjF (DUF2071 family)
MKQTWHDLLFAHWPLAPSALRQFVPGPLELDIFDSQCWIGVVPFRMSGVRARALPPLPGLSCFPELNVRTYVTYGGKPGVYFFSLDAANLPAVWAARAFYHLPYFHAVMTSHQHDGAIHYDSCRRRLSAELRANYRATSTTRVSARGTLDQWLTEGYCLYTLHRGDVYRGEIHHPRWALQDAEAEFEANTMAAAAGIMLPETKPLLHFASRQDVLIWPLRQV